MVSRHQFLEEAFQYFLYGFAVDVRQFLEKLFLSFAEFFWCFQDELDDLIPAAVSAQMRNTSALDTIGFTGLSASRNGNGLGFTVQQGDFDFSAQRRLRKSDGHPGEDVIAFAMEKIMRLYMDKDIEIPGGDSQRAGLSFATQAEAGAFVHASGNGDGDFLLFQHPSISMAGFAGIGNRLSSATALRTGGAHAEKSLRPYDLPGSTACSAGTGRGSRFATRAVAGLAFRAFVDFNLFVDSIRRFGESYGKIQTQVCTRLLTPAAAKKVRKDIAK